VTRFLVVYYKNTKAGMLRQDTDGTLTFQSDVDFLQADPANATSFSMPLREEQYSDQVVRPFFLVLHDEDARLFLAARLDGRLAKRSVAW
jgi:serine/threonine-protein kinase HipA